MRTEFSSAVLMALLGQGTLSRRDRVLVVCAGESDETLFRTIGFEHVCFTNVDLEMGTIPHGGSGHLSVCGEWQSADVHELPFEDGSFDASFVSDGLHHCHSPHRAVTEMYRVSRKATVVIESRDSATMRAALELGLTAPFEINNRLLDTRTNGGVDFGAVPNHVYRWTERDFEKLILSYDPAHRIAFKYFHGLSVPGESRIVRMVGSVLMAIAPRQGNTFAMVAMKGKDLQPFLDGSLGAPRLCPSIRTRDDVAAAIKTLRKPVRRHHTIK